METNVLEARVVAHRRPYAANFAQVSARPAPRKDVRRIGETRELREQCNRRPTKRAMTAPGFSVGKGSGPALQVDIGPLERQCFAPAPTGEEKETNCGYS